MLQDISSIHQAPLYYSSSTRQSPRSPARAPRNPPTHLSKSGRYIKTLRVTSRSPSRRPEFRITSLRLKEVMSTKQGAEHARNPKHTSSTSSNRHLISLLFTASHHRGIPHLIISCSPLLMIAVEGWLSLRIVIGHRLLRLRFGREEINWRGLAYHSTGLVNKPSL